MADATNVLALLTAAAILVVTVLIGWWAWLAVQRARIEVRIARSRERASEHLEDQMWLAASRGMVSR